MRRRAAILIAGLTAFAACRQGDDGPATPRVVPLSAPFRLPAGDSVQTADGGLGIAFRRVVEDSRCPRGAACIQAGNAAVELGVLGSSGGRATLILNTDRPPKRAAVQGHDVLLLEVEPHPSTEAGAEAGPSTAVLRVERAE